MTNKENLQIMQNAQNPSSPQRTVPRTYGYQGEQVEPIVALSPPQSPVRRVYERPYSSN
jgi:hypothetical protein